MTLKPLLIPAAAFTVGVATGAAVVTVWWTRKPKQVER